MKPCEHVHYFGYGTYVCELPHGHAGRHQQRGASWEHVYAHIPDGSQINNSTGGKMDRCTKPPHGWHCTRNADHEGPCAAIPVLADDDYVAWLRYIRHGERTTIAVCDSDAPGAFRVYRRRETR